MPAIRPFSARRSYLLEGGVSHDKVLPKQMGLRNFGLQHIPLADFKHDM